MTISTTHIENQAEVHRAHISELVDELRERVTPGEVLDQFLGWDEGHEMVRNFGRQVTANPLPLALIGTGVAWLMLSDGLQRRNGGYATGSSAEGRATKFGGASESVSNAVTNATDAARSAADTAGNAIKDKASQISGSTASALAYGRQTASDLAESAQAAYVSARDSVNAATDSVTATASSAWQKTTRLTQSATDSIKETGSNLGRMTQEQPLLTAGLGFALGMALGALFPATEMENSLLGEQSDTVKQKAGEVAEKGYEKAKAVAQRSYDAATEAATQEAKNQGLTPEPSEEMETGSSSERGGQRGNGESYDGNHGGDYRSGAYPNH